MTGKVPERVSPDEALDLLEKVLPEGRLQRIPRNPKLRDPLLALLAAGLHRRYPYGERELNDALQASLASLSDRVDHVTLRRYLVDCGFLKRDRAGTRYYQNFPKIEAVLADDSIPRAAELLAEALEAARLKLAQKKRQAAARRETG
ncbi:MAG: DUF2087 domain-containing protein [Pseudomonadota bacterium]